MKIKSLLQRVKWRSINLKKLFATHTANKGLIFRTYKELLQRQNWAMENWAKCWTGNPLKNIFKQTIKYMKTREMEIKARDIITYSLDWLKLQSMMVPNVCEDVQDGNHHTLPVGVYKHFRKQFGITWQSWVCKYSTKQQTIPHLDVHLKWKLETCTRISIAALFVIAKN